MKQESWREKFWALGNLTSGQTFRFATKTSIGVTALLLFQFFQATSHVFSQWRGEWSVVTLAVIVAPNFGVNYTNGIYRILGTIAGSIWSVITWYVCGTNPWGLWFMTLAFVLPVHYLCFSTRYTKLAFVSVTTLLVIVLSKKTNVEFHTTNHDEIYELAYKRATEVTLGVIFAFVVNRILWPNLARSRLRRKMSKTMIGLGELFSKVVATFARHEITESIVKEFEKKEAKLQLKVIHLNDLLTFSLLEPRLQGPFEPLSVHYRNLILSCQFILDRLRSTRIALVRGFREQVTLTVVDSLMPYRREMMVNVLCIFHLFGGSLYAKRPLPSYLPNAREARERLLVLFQQHPAVKEGLLNQTKIDYIYYFAYAEAMKELIDEADRMTAEIRILFGAADEMKGLWEEPRNLAIKVE